jgi:hypothetical protein
VCGVIVYDLGLIEKISWEEPEEEIAGYMCGMWCLRWIISTLCTLTINVLLVLTLTRTLLVNLDPGCLCLYL